MAACGFELIHGHVKIDHRPSCQPHRCCRKSLSRLVYGCCAAARPLHLAITKPALQTRVLNVLGTCRLGKNRAIISFASYAVLAKHGHADSLFYPCNVLSYPFGAQHPQSNITKYKDVEWSTETCAFAWPARVSDS